MSQLKLFFEADKSNAHDKVWSMWRALKQSYTILHTGWIGYGRHYNHNHWTRAIFSPSNYDSQFVQGGQNRLTLNVLKNVIDTIHSKIVKHQPDIAVLAEKDDPKAEMQADYVEKFLRERFKTLNLERLQMEAWLDACVYGTGVIKLVFNKDLEVHGKKIGELEAKKLMPYEVYVDHDTMGGSNDPNWVMHLRFLHIRECEKKYPSIRFNSEAYRADFPNKMNILGKEAEWIPAIELFHRKTDYMPKGRRILCVENQTLEYEDYDSKFLPFLFLHYSKAPFTFWGVGLGKVLRSAQVEINKILFHISQNQNMMGRPKMTVERGSVVFPEALSNGIPIIEYTGKPPELMVGNPTPPEVFEYLKFLIEQCYQSVGISLAAATGEPPPAVRSGIAMEHMAERENDRFALTLINYENFKKDLAHRVLYDARRNYKKEDDRWYKAVTDSHRYEKITFDDLDLEDENYHLNIVTTSSLGHTKAGQLEFLMNLVQMGLIKDPSQIMDLMRIPNEDKIFDSVIMDTEQAREEDVRMSKGEQIQVSEFEDHLAHIKCHIMCIKSTKFTKESPAIKKARTDHLHQHFAYLQATQQQQQAQQAPQPGQQQPLQQASPQAPIPSTTQPMGGNPTGNQGSGPQ